MTAQREIVLDNGVYRLVDEAKRCYQGPYGDLFRPHPNGGGLVAETATVAPSVHVGPCCRVFGRARLSGKVNVTGNARVGGNVVADGTTTFAGHCYKIAGEYHSGIIT